MQSLDSVASHWMEGDDAVNESMASDSPVTVPVLPLRFRTPRFQMDPGTPVKHATSFGSLEHAPASNTKQRRESRATVSYGELHTIDWMRDTEQEARTGAQFARLSSSPSTSKAKKRLKSAVIMIEATLIITMMGACAGVLSSFIRLACTWLFDLRLGICTSGVWLNQAACCWGESELTDSPACPGWVSWADYSILGFVMYVALGTLFAALAAYVVSEMEPFASGSGLPEIRVVLSGFALEGYFSLRTFVVKAVSVVLAVGSGLTLGWEGPMVHLTCCLGDIFCSMFGSHYFNDTRRQGILSVSAAVGMAVAFGAPLGGVLFGLETISYYFPHAVMWRAFLAALLSVLVLLYMNPIKMTGASALFNISFHYKWHWFEMVPFTALGIFGVRRYILVFFIIINCPSRVSLELHFAI